MHAYLRDAPGKPDVPRAARTAPLEMDDDLTRSDAWMFGPLIATVVALPLVATLLVGFSVWHLTHRTEAAQSAPPATFATRWPDQALPVIR